MKISRNAVNVLWCLAWALVAGLVFADAVSARADVPDVTGAAQLRAKYVALRDQLADNPFHRPLALDSRQGSGNLQGNVYALVEHPIAAVGAAVKGAPQWCEILILHMNVKHCSVGAGTEGDTLTTYIGRKHSQALTSAHRVVFKYGVAADAPDYLEIRLNADAGPLGTSDYRIVLEAVPLDSHRTFVHLSYAYKYGAAAALAMRTYFNTTGADKIGFTIVDRRSDGQPVHVGDLRGALERNTMRYFLAIDACLNTSSGTAEAQFERRLRNWFAATERFPLQLRELEQGEYLEMKRGEYRRLLAER